MNESIIARKRSVAAGFSRSRRDVIDGKKSWKVDFDFVYVLLLAHKSQEAAFSWLIISLCWENNICHLVIMTQTTCDLQQKAEVVIAGRRRRWDVQSLETETARFRSRNVNQTLQRSPELFWTLAIALPHPKVSTLISSSGRRSYCFIKRFPVNSAERLMLPHVEPLLCVRLSRLWTVTRPHEPDELLTLRYSTVNIFLSVVDWSLEAVDFSSCSAKLLKRFWPPASSIRYSDWCVRRAQLLSLLKTLQSRGRRDDGDERNQNRHHG